LWFALSIKASPEYDWTKTGSRQALFRIDSHFNSTLQLQTERVRRMSTSVNCSAKSPFVGIRQTSPIVSSAGKQEMDTKRRS
jgi:hypothetical protein